MIRARFAMGLFIASIAVACGNGGKVAPDDAGAGQASSGGQPGGSSGGGVGVSSSGSTGASSGAGSSSGTGSPPALGSVLKSVAVDKLDLLFMIDNSPSMGDKQALLAQAVPDMLNRLVMPNCIATDGSGAILGTANAQGNCAAGKAEFPPVHDMHIGIVTSSLGGRGASMTCDPTQTNVANPSLPSHNDDRGELINRGGADEHNVPNAGSPLNFLAWFPNVAANAGKPLPPVPPETNIGASAQTGTLIGDFTDMISGVHEHGCGFEAQNEAWYRFLVQPDPFDNIAISTDGRNLASLNGTDSVILNQRHAFLRPDSLLAVIVVTDENEEVANPMSVAREGWLYEEAPWPGSPTNGGAPRGTIECQSNPEDPNCTSCAFSIVVNGANYSSRCQPDPPSTVPGYYDPGDDIINVRFFHQKQRFGVFSGYPVSRYIRGLTSASVPDRAHEVDGNGNYVGDQDKYANCVNPIYAQNLPTDPTKDLCSLTRGPRTPDLVYYAVIGGVPHQLLQARPGDSECNSGQAAADCPQKNQLAESDWLSITGMDPEDYNFSGADPHMLESEDPRQTPCPPNSGDTCDPINGREWATSKGDLQFACIFQLPQPKDCTQMQHAGACDCNGGPSQNSPLCQLQGGTHTSTQINGKAYPSVREMVIAHTMADQSVGIQGIVSSLCPIHTTEMGAGDPVYGYRPAVNAIVNRIKNSLGVQCLPQKLVPDPSTGVVPCLVLVTLSKPGDESACNSIQGLGIPPANVLSRFQAAQHAAWIAAGGSKSSTPDPLSLPTCFVNELTQPNNPNDFGPDGTCSASMAQGWCYVEGSAAGNCPQQIVFTSNMPPQGSTVNLVCN